MKSLLAITLFFLLACSSNNQKSEVITPEEFTSPAGDSAMAPYLFTDRAGKIYLSWIERSGRESSLRFSQLNSDSWSKAVTIASGNNWFVNWADYPVIAASDSNNLIAHYLEKSDTAKYTYDIKLVASGNSGQSWDASGTLHDDETKSEHGFVSMIPYKNGFFITWLDGRKTATASGGDHEEGHHGEMTLRAAVLSADGKKLEEWELDGRVCDCCQTSAAVTEAGPVVVYRDRSEQEIRDIFVVRLINGKWTEPKPVFPDNWFIKGCPVNGPRVSALGKDLAIAWFSMREKQGEVKLIFSNDGGETFGKPIRIDEGKPIGRVGVVMLDSTSAFVSWMEGGQIKAVKINANGSKGQVQQIASSSEKRASGFPQMTRSGDQLYFAWTDEKSKAIKMARLGL